MHFPFGIRFAPLFCRGTSAVLTIHPCSMAYRPSAEVLNAGEVRRTKTSRWSDTCSICLP
jgi:hypothetical protein